VLPSSSDESVEEFEVVGKTKQVNKVLKKEGKATKEMAEMGKAKLAKAKTIKTKSIK
jgi:hypothetical protein